MGHVYIRFSRALRFRVKAAYAQFCHALLDRCRRGSSCRVLKALIISYEYLEEAVGRSTGVYVQQRCCEISDGEIAAEIAGAGGSSPNERLAERISGQRNNTKKKEYLTQRSFDDASMKLCARYEQHVILAHMFGFFVALRRSHLRVKENKKIPSFVAVARVLPLGLKAKRRSGVSGMWRMCTAVALIDLATLFFLGGFASAVYVVFPGASGRIESGCQRICRPPQKNRKKACTAVCTRTRRVNVTCRATVLVPICTSRRSSR